MTAMHLHHSRQPRAGTVARHAGLDALSDTSDWVLATLRQWRRRIRERQQLSQLNERTLSDIGLTRADAEFLANKPFWRE